MSPNSFEMLHLSRTSPVFTSTRTFFPPSDSLLTSRKKSHRGYSEAFLHTAYMLNMAPQSRPFWTIEHSKHLQRQQVSKNVQTYQWSDDSIKEATTCKDVHMPATTGRTHTDSTIKSCSAIKQEMWVDEDALLPDTASNFLLLGPVHYIAVVYW